MDSAETKISTPVFRVLKNPLRSTRERPRSMLRRQIVSCELRSRPLHFIKLGYMEELMKFRPLHDRVVIRRIEGDEKTQGGIIIPDTAKEKPQEGEVIAVGPGARDENGKVMPLDLKAGDRVLFGKWSGSEVKAAGGDAGWHRSGLLCGAGRRPARPAGCVPHSHAQAPWGSSPPQEPLRSRRCHPRRPDACVHDRRGSPAVACS